jgi:hypothetical protein
MSEKTFARVVPVAALILACLGFAPLVHLVQAQPPATLTIHADQPVSSVSPTLYGLMTEEINYSYDGGLYAEMVRNRTFRSDWSGVLYWYLLEDGNAAAKMEVDKTAGPSEALPSSLRLDVEHADARNQAGVLNVGWWGFALRPENTYKGSFYAKAGSSDLGPVTVSLVSDDTGKALATDHCSRRRHGLEAVRIRAEDRRAAAFVEQSPGRLRRPRRNSLAEPCLALPADLSRSREWQPHRLDGKTGRNASTVPALPRRELS